MKKHICDTERVRFVAEGGRRRDCSRVNHLAELGVFLLYVLVKWKVLPNFTLLLENLMAFERNSDTFYCFLAIGLWRRAAG